MGKQTCGDCRNFQLGVGGALNNIDGECRAMPPQARLNSEDVVETFFPRIDITGWCGYWSPKPEIHDKVPHDLGMDALDPAEDGQALGSED